MGYQTKSHPGIVPENLKARGQAISIFDGETIAIVEPHFVKKKRVNTPVKECFAFSSRRQIQFDEDKTVSSIDKQSNIQEFNAEVVNSSNDALIESDSSEASNSFQFDISDEFVKDIGDTSSNIEFVAYRESTSSLVDDGNDDDDGFDNRISELEALLPGVIHALETENQLESNVKFMELVANGNFPLHNVCYLAFLDICEWFSSCNTSQMRYKYPETCKFWDVAYKLFHGKLLRFLVAQRTSVKLLPAKKFLGNVHQKNRRSISLYQV